MFAILASLLPAILVALVGAAHIIGLGILGATIAYSFVYLIIVIIVVVIIFWLLIAVIKILPPGIGWAICAVIIVILLILWLVPGL